ncbi:hypothetical protein ES703_55967 [subsurface metagenome]
MLHVPVTVEIAAADVWTHITRTLTDLTKIYFDAELAKIKNRSGSTYDFQKDSLEAAGEEVHHITGIFPNDTNLTLTFTAHANANEWSSWAEIIDNIGNKFSDGITREAHITSFLLEKCETKEKVFMFEVAYGDAKTIVSRYRFIAGVTAKLPPIQQVRIRGDHLPVDEKLYYHMKCEQAGSKTCQLHIRHYLARG